MFYKYFFLQEVMEALDLRIQHAAYRQVERMYGIALTWSEKIALHWYLILFNEQRKVDSSLHPNGVDAIHWFMIDYFGLDGLDLGKRTIFTIDWGGSPQRIMVLALLR